ncbi:hypothetical protein E2C01_015615 [Portunus trituberculatus]|uniref:Uncharacterized protein n=1 Tax=Portunus trituberculatus TaxID=210409 RepID=A0A5B7DNF4_PORTR|nr:hypothetical protein [Portunus trituberculatus]
MEVIRYLEYTQDLHATPPHADTFSIDLVMFVSKLVESQDQEQRVTCLSKTKKTEEQSIALVGLEEENTKLKSSVQQMVGFVYKIKDSYDAAEKIHLQIEE